MPVLDPSGFQIAVVVKRDDVRFPLWVGGARRDDVSLFLDPTMDFPDIPIVESVTIDIGLGMIGKLGVEIAAPYDLGMALLESRLFTIGSVIEVQVGYPKLSRFIPWFSAMQSKPSINLSQDEGLSASLNGEAGAFAAARSGSSETFDASYADIIRTIAEREHNQWTLSLPSRLAGEADALYEPRQGVSQADMTEWVFIMHISRLANCDAYIAQDSQQVGRNCIVVRRRSEIMGGQPRFIFVSRGRADFINTFPLLEFESSAEQVWLPRSAGEIRAAFHDPDTGETREVVASRTTSTTPRAPGDATSVEGSARVDGTTVALESSRRDDRATGERIAPSPRASATPEEVVSSRSEEGSQSAGLKANMTTIGIPELYPGDVIRIEGAGIFNGNYGIESVQHNVTAEAWSTSLQLLSNSMFNGENLMTGLSARWEQFGQRVNQESPVEVLEAASGATEEVESEFADLAGLGGGGEI